ncbi:hypothetical protein LEP1GSC096_1605 [Leptospira interrogans serovar Hebdomadis str. R499]|nr:hypothetical protein LEP1GSC069_2896 [Leptospira interrogans serovar Canicola str. Fiocruz LV133]EKR37532.1 hypothetical protein LEP1GSC096_1605 [Leptospira interrogans serovar Hebdomadis str. R499]EMJ61473.1 hypothetical protein LEP1GSC197_4320 [Leptospira interrogans serovar Pomona str. CSL4002]EMK23670.1 hypothetical protein LEP1GSC075_2215 [Leptospira interrogans str. Kito]EMN77020.1 hypothetical protein LEP1GSC102_3897 [Leptospira interrogans str. UI 09600]
MKRMRFYRFVVVPTFKESICKVQISNFRIMSSLYRVHFFKIFDWDFLDLKMV